METYTFEVIGQITVTAKDKDVATVVAESILANAYPINGNGVESTVDHLELADNGNPLESH